MKLYDVGMSVNCRKVRVVARELGLPLSLVPVDLLGAKAPEYLALHPAGKVPAFVDDDGFVLWESGAIAIHLAEKKPDSGLFPIEPHARANVLRWLFFAANHLQPWISLLGQERLIKPRRGLVADPAVIALAERELARFLPIVEQELAGRDYLTGSYTLADIVLGSGFESCEARGVQLELHPRSFAWRERLRQRPAWAD